MLEAKNLSAGYPGRAVLAGVSPGVRTIVLTVVISLAAAVLFPVGDEEQEVLQ